MTDVHAITLAHIIIGHAGECLMKFKKKSDWTDESRQDIGFQVLWAQSAAAFGVDICLYDNPKMNILVRAIPTCIRRYSIKSTGQSKPEK